MTAAPHPAMLALAALAWEAQQAAQPPPETTAELVASCWAAQARLDTAQARAKAALDRLAA